MNGDLFPGESGIAKDPNNYREMCIPFEDPDELEVALRSFYDGVAELRKKSGLANVHILVVTPVMDGGEEIEMGGSLHLGDSMKSLLMLAQAYGNAKGEYEHKMSALVNLGMKRAIKS